MREDNYRLSWFLFPTGGIVLALANLLDSHPCRLYKIGSVLAIFLWLTGIAFMIGGWL
jgi:hypothetical protein